MPALSIELLVVPSCPHVQRAWRELTAAIAELQVDARVSRITITTQAQADALGFGGSPSIRVNGQDLENYDGPGVLACRTYGPSLDGSPDPALIREQLRAAAAEIYKPVMTR